MAFEPNRIVFVSSSTTVTKLCDPVWYKNYIGSGWHREKKSDSFFSVGADKCITTEVLEQARTELN